MVLAQRSGGRGSERVRARIGHAVSQPNGLGQTAGKPRQRGWRGALRCQGLSGTEPEPSAEHDAPKNLRACSFDTEQTYYV